jgi:hypothetical protein
MPAKVRKDPMGPATMGLLKNNADFVQRLSLVEHRDTGEHNAREIARAVRRISGTTVSPSSSDITAVTNGTTGTYVLTLAAGRFDAAWMTCQINPCGAGVASKPYLTGYKVISSTSLEVYIKQLTPALGYDPAGNVFAASNCDFDIAIHSEPLMIGAYATDLPANSLTGDPLKPSRWNALVQAAGEAYAVLTPEHTAAGVHNTRQISCVSGLFRYGGSVISLTDGEATGISITRTSIGQYAIASSSALTTQTHCFVSPDHMRTNSGNGSELYRMHVLQSSTTAWVMYIYRFNRSLSTWDRADGDFWLAMHKG